MRMHKFVQSGNTNTDAHTKEGVKQGPWGREARRGEAWPAPPARRGADCEWGGEAGRAGSARAGPFLKDGPRERAFDQLYLSKMVHI